MTAAEDPKTLVVDSAWFKRDFAQALLRARARRRARMTPEELARDIAREAAEKKGELRVPPPKKWGGRA